MADYLTTSGVDSLISSYQSVQYARRIYPLEVRQQKFSTLSSGWGDLKTKMTALKSSAYDFKTSTDSSLFFTRSVKVSNDSILTATADINAVKFYFCIQFIISRRCCRIYKPCGSIIISNCSTREQCTC